MKLDFRSMCRRCLRLMRLALYITLFFYAVNYFLDARDRAYVEESPHEWTIYVETVKGVSYTAKTTFIDRYIVLLRLYRTGDPTLLAERIFTEHGVEIFWGRNELVYDTSDDSFLGGAIQLPPTRLDELLAKLP